MKTYHYIIRGKVQGVAFRYYTVKSAFKNQIYGTVQNLYNGDVEVYAQGEDENIRRFEAFLHSGPPAARIDQVIRQELQPNTVYTEFEII